MKKDFGPLPNYWIGDNTGSDGCDNSCQNHSQCFDARDYHVKFPLPFAWQTTLSSVFSLRSTMQLKQAHGFFQPVNANNNNDAMHTDASKLGNQLKCMRFCFLLLVSRFCFMFNLSLLFGSSSITGKLAVCILHRHLNTPSVTVACDSHHAQQQNEEM